MLRNGLFPAARVTGTVLVIATCGCSSGSTEPAQLTSLTIDPQSVSLLAGATQQFTSTVTWSSASTTLPPLSYSATGGTVSPTGLYVAPGTAGTYRVIVAHDGGTLRDTAVVTVTTPPPTSAFTPNLPSGEGLSLVFDTRFANPAATEVLNSEGFAFAFNGRYTTDITGPHGNNVFETMYPGNDLGNGVGGAKLYTPETSSWRKIYFSIAVWVPANYSVHSNSEKFWYPLVATNGAISGNTPIEWGAIEGGPNGTQFGFTYIDAPGQPLEPQTGPGRITKGQWTRIECFMQMNTPNTSNGILRLWVDGVVAENRSDFRYYNGAVQSVWNGMRFDGTRGGGASSTPTPPGGQVRRYNRLAFYAAP